MNKKDKLMEEYLVLNKMLEHIEESLEGYCDDIDCNAFTYKDLLKKKYKPTLDHTFSCIPKLKKEKKVLLGILSLQKYKKYRYEKCPVCKKPVDKLDNKKSTIFSYTKPSEKGFVFWEGEWCHKNCEKKMKIPEGWSKK